jgi:hypothetical protein
VKFASFRTFSLRVQLKEGEEILGNKDRKAFEKCGLKLASGTNIVFSCARSDLELSY